MQQKDEDIRQLESMANGLLMDKSTLQAHVDESNWWVYHRGPVADKIKFLEELRTQQTQEINRLTMENTKVMDDLRYSEAMFGTAGRRR